MCYAKLAVYFLVYTAKILRECNTQKYLNALQHMEGNSLKAVLTWLLSIKFNEIYVCYSNTQ